MDTPTALLDAVTCSSLSVAGPSSSSSSLSSTSTVGSPSAAAKEICKFFKMGLCRYGSACRNAHVAAPEEPEPGPSFAADPGPSTSSFSIDPLKWINAPEFVPKFKQWQPSAVPEEILEADQDFEAEEHQPLPNYAEDEAAAADDEAEGDEEFEDDDAPAAGGGMSYAAIVTMNNNHNGLGIIEDHVDSVLCPYFENSGVCMLDTCPYAHGEMCELCGKFCLNPLDKEQQRLHNVECIKQHELDMEHSFAIQRSKDKICGICLEVILEKPSREQRFGILPNCSHIFCLECIRTWRQAKNFENKIKRGCPTCRVSSDFVCPSIVWVESREEKEKLINDYKKACNTTHCKHFKQGTGKCPFGNKCFYKHALPNGQLVDVGGPSRQADSRLRISHLQDFFREVLYQRGHLLDDFMSSIFSDTEESDNSDSYDLYDI
ncbi:probable E3 ubiquitin-protein ligase makorin-1 [Armigeres subalbatus]|uniref:probable E3 ubiquitin-protein ligase makorin-1 n=1 Tax=Armigeres subalbatus TaxID=124917 RepID=UPI002ED24804